MTKTETSFVWKPIICWQPAERKQIETAIAEHCKVLPAAVLGDIAEGEAKCVPDMKWHNKYSLQTTGKENANLKYPL